MWDDRVPFVLVRGRRRSTGSLAGMRTMPRLDVPQTLEDLKGHLEEQLRFLAASADAYDSGFEGEAKRLAGTIRVLLHHSRTSHALLEQLGILSSSRFFDSALPNPPGNLSTYSGLLVMAHLKDGANYLALLDDHQIGPGEWVSFSNWWSCTVFVDSSKRGITRKDLVLSVANQDGGAHVDPALNQAYADLSRSNSLGWMRRRHGDARPMGPPHLAAVRQIAHETLKTLRPGYTKNGPPVEALMFSAGVAIFDSPTIPRDVPALGAAHIVPPVRTAQASGRNAPCSCGSGKKFKKCHGAAR